MAVHTTLEALCTATTKYWIFSMMTLGVISPPAPLEFEATFLWLMAERLPSHAAAALLERKSPNDPGCRLN